jgi:predicted O-methyltransferase YrrM
MKGNRLYRFLVRFASQRNKHNLRYPLWLLRDKKQLKGVEIGVMYGTHAKNIMKKLDMAFLFGIDPNPKCEGKQNWYIIEEESQNYEMVDEFFSYGELDFVYIDGDHSYEAVKKDIQMMYYRVKHGGLVAGHDFNHQGVSRAVTEFAARHNLKVYTYGFPTDWWMWRK